MDRIPVISHLAKTAGTSLRFGLRQVLGSRLLEDYGRGPLMHRPLDHAAVIGHFHVTRYDAFERYIARCVFYREPSARIVSLYRYRLHRFGVPDGQGPGVMAYATNDAGIRRRTGEALGAAKHLYVDLDGRTPDDFAFVGLTEQYARSLRLFHTMFGIEVPELRKNVSPGPRRDEGVWSHEAIREAQPDLQAGYRAASERFEALCAEHGVA